MRWTDKNFQSSDAARLEVQYLDRRPAGAYLYLPCRDGERYRGSRPEDKGMYLDYSDTGHLLGIEITAPRLITASDINTILSKHGLSPVNDAVLQPLSPARPA